MSTEKDIIVVTPQMVSAGEDVIERLKEVSPNYLLAEEVYRTMQAVKIAHESDSTDEKARCGAEDSSEC